MSSPPMSTTNRSLSPQALLERLDGIRRRVTLLGVARGLGLVIATAAALFLFGAIADWLLRLPGWPRLIGLAGSAVLLAWLAYRHIWLPLSSPPSLDDVAGRAEEHFDVFDDRLRSAVSFMGPDAQLPADPMRRLTVEEAGVIGGGIEWNDLLRPKPAITAGLLAAAGVGLLLALATLLGPLAGTIAGRLIDPLNPNHQWPKRFGVAAGELPTLHPTNRPLVVSATLTKGDPDRVEPVVLYRLGATGPVRRVLMTRNDDGTFAASIDPRLAEQAASGDLSVWVEAGDDTSTPEVVRVVRRPALVSAVLDVVPPPYARGERDVSPRRVDLTEGAAFVGVGSDVSITLGFSKPLADEGDVVSVEGDQFEWLIDGTTATAQVVADQSLLFSATARGIDGFTSDPSPSFEVVVRPDTPPTVQIDEPRRNGSRTPEAVVPLVATAEDDFGLESAQLIVERLAPQGGEGWQSSVSLFDAGVVATEAGRNNGRRYRLSLDWSLSQSAVDADAELRPGDVLEYYIRVQDNFDLAGERHEAVESSRQRITIISQAELNREVIRELQQVKEQVDAARRRQAAAKRETAVWADETSDKQALDPADQEAGERLTRRQSREAAAVKRLAERVREANQRLAENQAESEDLEAMTERVARQLNDAAEGPMREAASDIDAARLAEEAEARTAAAAEAAEAQEQADEQLASVMQEMESIGTLRQSTDAIRRLLEQQKELDEQADAVAKRNVGKTPEQMSDADREEAERLADEQEELADDTEAAIEQMQTQAEAAQGEEQEPDPSAEAMKKAARAGRQQDVAGQQRQAASKARQNQQSEADEARAQAELGLEIVLRQLEDAEREALRRLQRRLAELREQIERLIRLQAGHNADNLSLRGVADDALVELLVLSGRDEDRLVKPTLDRLSAGQEQSEQNARDLAGSADSDAEDGGQIGELLTRAALRMERAAVALRADDLPSAYEPPQVQALATLREALEAADEEEQRVADELERQEREAIRQRLINLRDAQVAEVNEPTDALSARAAAGELPRRERLQPRAVLAPRQLELADELADVGAALGEAGGTVFVYATDAIEADMRALADRLTAIDLSDQTLMAQQLVAAGLDDLIDSLSLEQQEERFQENSQAGAAGGEGEQEQGPPLPPAAEIKLFGKLQAKLNEATKRAHDAGDDPSDLSKKQGELRQVLDEMLQKASEGKLKFAAEPAADTLLPEEAGDGGDVEGALDDRELLDDLLGDAGREGEREGEEPAAGEGGGGEASVRRLGDYLARSRQRLSDLRDAGPVTQAVQDRIIVELEDLAEQANQQSSSSSSSSSAGKPGQQKPGQPGGAKGVQQQPKPQPGQPQPGQQGEQQQGEQQGQNQNGSGDEAGEPPAGVDADLSRELEETLAEWGSLTPRQRQAILDTRTDQPLDVYRELTEAFYKTLSEKEKE